MVAAITQAYEDDLKSVDWMTPETRAKAVVKLGQMRKKIGYPDHWRDYGAHDDHRATTFWATHRGPPRSSCSAR